MATPREINFSLIDDERCPLPVRPTRTSRLNTPHTMTKKQLRARARRLAKRGKDPGPLLSKTMKPIEDWDLEELARGRPRDRAGGFSGRKPMYIARQVHEEALSRFRTVVKGKMNQHTIIALDTIEEIMTMSERDENGKFMVSPATKLAAATFLLEHVVGKPTQRVEQDISVKLQAILASAVVMPGTLPALADAKQLVVADGDGSDYIDVEAED